MKIPTVILFMLLHLTELSFTQELNWKHLNGPMGGIVFGMDINSNGDIYAGVYPFLTADYTGLYKSTNNGDNWDKIQTQFEDFHVFSIYITVDNHIWVGTDYQDRLYRSTDDGLTWEVKNNGFNTGECWAIGQSKDGVLFAGDANTGHLYRSTDNGENWMFSASIATLAFAVDSNNVVYAGTFNGLYSSTDNGVTWIQNNFLSGFIIPSVIIDQRNIIYCGTGYPYISSGDGVYYSGDGGQSWMQLGLGGISVLSLDLDSKGNLFAGTLSDGLFKTTDMGQTWKQYQKGLYRQPVFRLKINEQDDIFVGSEGDIYWGDGGIFRLTHEESAFKQVGLPISNIKNVVFSGDSLIFTSTPSGVQKYNRVTKEWSNLGLYKVEAVAITPSNNLYAATRDEGLYKSTDLGGTWELIKIAVDTIIPIFNVLPLNDDTIFVATDFWANARRTTDGGQNWDILPIKSGSSSRGLFLINNDLWITGRLTQGPAHLFHSPDMGGTFNSTISNLGSNEAHSPFAITNNGFIYLIITENPRGIFRSTNNGLDWEQLLFDIRYTAIFANENGLVITGSSTRKIYISNNYGNNWSSFDQLAGSFITYINKDTQGNFFFASSSHGLYHVDIITNVDDNVLNSNRFHLSQNYPNPFNPSTIISWQTPVGGLQSLKVYDVLGREVATLVNEYKEAGKHSVEFNSAGLPSSVYFYMLNAGSFSETKKMILLR